MKTSLRSLLLGTFATAMLIAFFVKASQELPRMDSLAVVVLLVMPFLVCGLTASIAHDNKPTTRSAWRGAFYGFCGLAFPIMICAAVMGYYFFLIPFAISSVMCVTALLAGARRPAVMTRPLRWCLVGPTVAWGCLAGYEAALFLLSRGSDRIPLEYVVLLPILAVLSLSQFVAFIVTIDRVLRGNGLATKKLKQAIEGRKLLTRRLIRRNRTNPLAGIAIGLLEPSLHND